MTCECHLDRSMDNDKFNYLGLAANNTYSFSRADSFVGRFPKRSPDLISETFCRDSLRAQIFHYLSKH